jgi:hypothetical protein
MFIEMVQLSKLFTSFVFSFFGGFLALQAVFPQFWYVYKSTLAVYRKAEGLHFVGEDKR